MSELKPYYAEMSKEELIKIIEHQHQELLIIDAIKNEYKKHLEQVIVYHSVENYRDTVRKNREVAVTTHQKN